MATLKTVLHSKINHKGEKIHRLALRVTVNRHRSYLYLGHNIDLKDWDKESEKVKRSHPKYNQLNRLIRKKYDQIEDVIFESESNKEMLSAKQIIERVRSNKKGKTFFELAEEHVSDLKKSGKHNRAISDNSKVNRIKEFVGQGDLDFKEIDETMLKKFKTYLMSNRELSERSVMNIFVLIRTLYNVAIKDEIVEQKFYPFGRGKIKIKYPQTIKIGLEEEEIIKIEELELDPGTSIWHTRNVFLFSFYLAGIRISDVLRMKWRDIVDNRIYYKMNKNNKVDSLKLPPKVIAILEFYKDTKRTDSDFIFPELKTVNMKDSKAVYSRIKTSTKKFNNYLGEIGGLAKINKKITSHIARHSFGNIAGDRVSPQMLQKLYRHSSLSTTIGYQGNFIHKNTDEALDAVIDFSK